MKTCHIYPVSASAGMYQWKWTCIDGKRKSESARAFELFYDCVEDARSHGAKVDLDHAHEDVANPSAKKNIAPPKSIAPPSAKRKTAVRSSRRPRA